jgi:signal transduction histidine kinase
VREAKQSAFAPANQTALAISLACLTLGIGLSLAAAFGTKLILRGLQKITASADSLREGAAEEFAALEGQDEVARISHSLAALFTGLKSSNIKLADLNRDLDRKVKERTQEVRRLSEETRNAAVTRERLRLSRDLHDTLAHSMLAMLTQVRMMRKISKSRPELLEEELGLAEKAAREGLKIAREAVTDLRYFAVRDDGLGEALAKLVKRLKERVEIEASLEVDEAVATMAGPLAETLCRIAEEALRNVDRHAAASKVSVKAALDRSDPANHVLTLSIADNGRGFDASNEQIGHFGLIGMREQAEIISGALTIDSAPGMGTKIALIVST